ncbi:MAG TPA: SLBB domain-containing protein [Longimicrobiales bacterium]|nr:SLBB domain-containing protein [Longimicrobiales bacterium]
MRSRPARFSIRRSAWLLSLVVAQGLATSGSARGQSTSEPPTAGVAAQSDIAALQPGDAIGLEFMGHEEWTGSYTIDERFVVVLPLLGSRSVLDIPADALKRQILDAYDQLTETQQVAVRALRRVRVLGAVQRPGVYHVDATMGLADAIGLAGGATQDGKLHQIRVVREGTEQSLDLLALSENDRLIRSGDIVVVPGLTWLERHSGTLVAALISSAGFIAGFLINQ